MTDYRTITPGLYRQRQRKNIWRREARAFALAAVACVGLIIGMTILARAAGLPW